MTSLFKEFDPKSKADWLKKVEKDLKGQSLDMLNWQWTEELKGTPFYHREDLKNSFSSISTHRTSNSWQIGAYIPIKNINAAHQQVIELLNRGVEALCYSLNEEITSTDLYALLKDIRLEWISTHFQIPGNNLGKFCKGFIHLLQERSLDPNQIKASFRITPIQVEHIDWQQLNDFSRQLPQAKFLMIYTQTFYKGKETILEELAQAIHIGNQLLTQLNKHQLSVKRWCRQISFSILLDDIYFLNIVKIRVLKLLWKQILDAWGCEGEDAYIEVHLTKAVQSPDADYNKIKATTQAMSAVIGGANRLFIHPSDAYQQEEGTSFSQRIALNIQHLLKEESYLDRVVDPSAGSYFLETLTNTIAQKSWAKFQELEAKR